MRPVDAYCWHNLFVLLCALQMIAPELEQMAVDFGDKAIIAKVCFENAPCRADACAHVSRMSACQTG